MPRGKMANLKEAVDHVDVPGVPSSHTQNWWSDSNFQCTTNLLDLFIMVETSTKPEAEWEGSSMEKDGAHDHDNDAKPMEVDARVRRKVDLNLIPLIAILYLCSFL